MPLRQGGEGKEYVPVCRVSRLGVLEYAEGNGLGPVRALGHERRDFEHLAIDVLDCGRLLDGLQGVVVPHAGSRVEVDAAAAHQVQCPVRLELVGAEFGAVAVRRHAKGERLHKRSVRSVALRRRGSVNVAAGVDGFVRRADKRRPFKGSATGGRAEGVVHLLPITDEACPVGGCGPRQEERGEKGGHDGHDGR